MRIGIAASLAASLLLAGAALAADVKITGLHNCCPMCAKALTTTLDTTGATNVKISPTEVSFSSAEPDKVVKALYEAGFAGKVEGAKAPEVAGAKGLKTKTLKLAGVHNCCGRCTKAIQDTVKPFGTCDITAKATSFTITSDTEIDAEKVVAALRAAGYNVKVAK